MGEERRQRPRVRCYLPVRLYPKGQFKVVETLTKDIGAGGLCVLSPTFKPTYSPVSVDLVFGPNHHALSLNGHIVWFQVLPQSEQFKLGIEFDDVPPKKQILLSGYLGKISSSSSSERASK